MNIYSNEAKQYLMENGVNIIRDFCTLNNIKEPTIKLSNFRTTKKCGVYDGRIKVDLSKCAKASNLYSFPNLYVNRTPQGVVTHEFGHYLQDVLKISTRTLTKQYNKINEKPISSYAPNSSEWFAEIIKLFTTNPDLLKLGRPKTYNWLVNDLKLKPLTRGDYINVLKEFNSDLNERIIQRANKFAKIKIKEDKDIIEWSVAFIMKKTKNHLVLHKWM